MYFWNNKNHTTCVQMPEIFLDFSDQVALTLLTFALLGLVLTAAASLLMFCCSNGILMNKSKDHLNGSILLGLVGLFSSTMTFIGKPTDLMCRIREPLVCSILSFVIICIITMTVQMVQPTTGNKLIYYL